MTIIRYLCPLLWVPYGRVNSQNEESVDMETKVYKYIEIIHKFSQAKDSENLNVSV